MLKFLCITCDIDALFKGNFVKHKQLNVAQAIWHRLKGHEVIRAWKVDENSWQHTINFLGVLMKMGLTEKIQHLIDLRQPNSKVDIGSYNVFVRQLLEELLMEQYHISSDCAKAIVDVAYYSGH